MGRVRWIVACAGLTIVAGFGTVAGPALARSEEPLERYPRRPGAKAGEVEVPVDTWLTFAEGSVVLRTPEVVGELPPTDALAPWRNRDVEGFAPRLSESGERVLHVRIDFESRVPSFPMVTRCDVTAASDGAIAQMLGWASVAPPPLLDVFGGDVPSSTTVAPPTPPPPFDPANSAEFWLPIGERTGRFYLACQTVGPRVVWGFDVA